MAAGRFMIRPAAILLIQAVRDHHRNHIMKICVRAISGFQINQQADSWLFAGHSIQSDIAGIVASAVARVHRQCDTVKNTGRPLKVGGTHKVPGIIVIELRMLCRIQRIIILPCPIFFIIFISLFCFFVTSYRYFF